MEQYSKEIPTVDIIALHNYLYEESYDEHEEGNYLCYLIPTRLLRRHFISCI